MRKIHIGDTPEQLKTKLAHIDDALLVGGFVYTAAKLKEILAERDALAAQVEACNDVLKTLLKSLPWIGGSLQSDGQFYYKVAESVFKKAETALAKTSQQCLAEIRAEYGRDGFIAGATRWNACDAFGDFVPAEKIEKSANEYAESVRQGGE